MMQSSKYHQQGIAIITVLLIVALMVTLLAFLGEQQQLVIRRISNQNVSEKGYQYALGVNAWAQKLLSQDANRVVDYLDEDWAKFGKPPEIEDFDEFSLTPTSELEEEELPTVDFGNEAELNFEIIDLQSRFNLNNLASTRDEEHANEQKVIYQNILQAAGIDIQETRDQLYGALRDWLDENDLKSAFGFESSDYGGKDAPYFAADQKMVSLAELRFVEGYTAEIINLITPFVVVLPVDFARLNLNTVSSQVLASLSRAPVVELGSVDAFLANREDINFLGFQPTDIENAKTAISEVSPFGQRLQPVQNMLQTHSQFFQVNTEVALGDFNFCMKTILLRENASEGSVNSPGVHVINRQHNSFGLCTEQNNNTVATE